MNRLAHNAEIIDHNELEKHRCRAPSSPATSNCADVVMIGFPGSNRTGLAAGAASLCFPPEWGPWILPRLRTEL